MWLTLQNTLNKRLDKIILIPFGFSLEFPAFIQASASLDTLKANDLAEWTLEKNPMPLPEQTCQQDTQFSVTTNPKKLTRNNRTHRSSTDGEARLAQKPGKAFRLYYLSSMAVDTAHHVIVARRYSYSG